jgi:DNA-binding transcriptional ArsR family regulator
MAVDQLSRVFTALGDPTRRAILQRLMSGDADVAELAKPFAMSQPAISHHLKVLEDAGLVSRGRVANSRPRHLEVETLKEATMWMDDYRRFWDESYTRLGTLLEKLQREEGEEK